MLELLLFVTGITQKLEYHKKASKFKGSFNVHIVLLHHYDYYQCITYSRRTNSVTVNRGKPSFMKTLCYPNKKAIDLGEVFKNDDIASDFQWPCILSVH